MALWLSLIAAPPASGQVIITEFMASNLTTLADGDGNYSDWIELRNTSPAAVSLAGWHLTDDPQELTKWTFPAGVPTTLATGQYLTVFASGSHLSAANLPIDPYFDSGGRLHANFKLNADGGYLALVKPDGLTVASEFGTAGTPYPSQQADVSYGLGATREILLAPGAPAAMRVPVDGSLGQAWTATTYLPGPDWTQGTTGVGFAPDARYTPLLGTNVQAAMLNHNATAYLRVPFVVTDPAALKSLALNLRYDDGFIAYLNGGEVAARNQPPVAGSTVSLPLLQAASAISWSTGYSVPTQEGGRLEFGALDNSGTLFRERTLLRFDASSIAAVAAAVQSVRLELTVQTQYGGASSGPGRVDLYRVDPIQTAWTSEATVLEKTGNGAPPAGDAGSVAWTGGVNVFATHTGSVLAGATVDRLASPGTVFTWTITGAVAQQLIDDWRAGGNSGLALVDSGATAGRDYRSNCYGLNGTATQQPQLTITYAEPPATWQAAAIAERSAEQVVVPEVIDLTAALGQLRAGLNVLAIHGLNRAATDPDFLILPELFGYTAVEDPANPGYLADPSPGAGAATGALPDYVRDTNFTATEPGFHGRGFYDAAFSVAITSATQDAVIYYTTDGSRPHDGSDGAPVNGIRYTSPIRIATTTTLRAAAFKPGSLPTNVDTQTYVFPGAVLAQQATPPGFPTTWGPVSADYAMDSRIVASPLYAATIRQDLQSLPVISLVLDNADLFGPNGIYSNTEAAGDEWERPVSVEYFDPAQPGREFQVDAGVQILGSSQRTPIIRKHGFRVNFKAKYGAANLRFPIYPDTKVSTFDNLSLHPGGHDGCAFNTDIPQSYSWPYGQATFARARWLFQSQLDMGQPGVHGDFVHLYLNGLYWGQYRLNERPDAGYAAEYFGGTKDDYDVIKHRSPIGSTGQPNLYEIAAGDDAAWLTMYHLAAAGLAGETQYQAIRQYLDIESFIDYLLVNMVCGNLDWPDKNWYATRRRVPGAGFRFYCWDGEITLGLEDPATDRTGVNGANCPGFIYAQLRANPEFRRLFGDRVQRHLFGGGALSVAAMQARFTTIANKIESSIVPESARWGDATIFHPPPNTVLYTRETHWRPEVSRVVNQIIPQRAPLSLQQFRAAGLYPNLAATVFSQAGGEVPTGYLLSLTHPNAGGTIYFTLDGSDPRAYGTAGIGATAAAYNGPLAITSPTRIRARVLDGASWSAENDASFRPPQDLTNLVLSEIMYHPAAAVPGTEFIEFTNVGPVPLDLTGVRFGAGLSFAFLPGTIVAAGARVLVVENRAAFEAAYGTLPGVVGEFQPSNLANSGELLRVVDGLGNVLESVAYDDAFPWPTEADGLCHSLVRIAPSARLNPALAGNWRGSVAKRGNPGASDATILGSSPDGLLTYALGGSGLPWLTHVNDEIRYGFRRNLAADDVIFAVEFSNDLQTWHADGTAIRQLSATNHGDGTTDWVFSAPTTSDCGYFRLKLSGRAPSGE